MPNAKVRHGLISYLTVDKDTDREYEDRAFRGMTVNLSQKEYDRLLAHEAIIPADQELDQPGSLVALPAGASDEELLNWAMAAKESEIKQLAGERPELADRLRDAHEEAKRRMDYYNEHLGGVLRTAEEGAEAAAEARQTLEEDLIGGAGGEPPSPDQTPPGGPVVTEEQAAFDVLVQGSNRDVENYLGEHPEHATQVLEAENRRVEAARAAGAADAQPRGGVVKAAEVAAQHVQS